MGGISIWHWLIVLLVVVLVFGTKKLSNIGKDLGEGIKGFKKGLKDGDEAPPSQLGNERRDAGGAPRQDAPQDSQRKDS